MSVLYATIHNEPNCLLHIMSN